jgi:hypothetical protein
VPEIPQKETSNIKQKERATTRGVVAVGHVTKDAEEELAHN